MSTVKSSNEHLTFNADGVSKEIKFQINGTEVAKINASTGIDVTGSVTCDGLVIDGDVSVKTGYNQVNFHRDYDVTAGVAGMYLGIGALYSGVKVNPVQMFGEVDTDGTAYGWGVLMDGYEKLRVTPSGNVGIGTSSPAQKLQIESSSEAGIRLNNTMSNNWDITNDSNLKFTRGSTERMRIDSTGNVGIGTSSPSEKLYVSGNIYATGNVTAYSDERIKKNINEIPNALDAVDAIRGVTYTRTDTEEDSVGVIAQEVEAMFPELITENNEGMKSVNYNGLIGVLFSAVKELSAKVRKLEND